MHKFVIGNVESLDQMTDFISGLSDSEYQLPARPWFESSIGQHLRHVIDLYVALMKSDGELIDYDYRRRGAAAETNRTTGLAELKEIRGWLADFSIEDINNTILVSTETALSTEQTEVFTSSLGRELCFASSHLTHHLAIMATIAKVSGKDVNAKLGLAPATATFVREQAKQACAH
ncbi:MAG: hypothetical protein ACJA0N_000612 [Pseudohongiellaceae bacterium]|jgi:hypothetical protein